MRRGMLLISGTKQAQLPSGLGVSVIAANTVRVSWTNPDPSMYDAIVVEGNTSGAGYAVVGNPGKGATFFDAVPGYSVDTTYRIKAVKTGWQDSAYVVSGNARTQPNVPSPQGLSAQNPGQITFSANSPGHTNIAGFDVALSTDGGSNYGGTIDTGPDPSHVFSSVGHNLVCQVRTRTRDGFGQVSGWVTWSSTVTSINDVTGPPAPTVTIGAWNIAQAAFAISWPAHFDSQSANNATYLQYEFDLNGTWNTVSVTYPAGPAYSGLFGPGSDNRGKYLRLRLVTYDVWGNGTTGPASAAAITRPLGGAILYPGNTHTWGATTGWRSADDRVIGGAFGGQENYGFWFYGTALADWCRGHVPDRVYFLCQKVSGLSASGIAYIAGHDTANDTGAVPNIGSIFATPSLGVGGVNTLIDPGWYPYFMNGTYKGASCIGNGAAFKAIYGKSEDSSSGAFTVYFDQ
jgi:hypothetical protein